MKIILLGSTGLIGSALLKEFQHANFEVIAPTHAECDVTKPQALSAFLKNAQVDFVVNATGYTAVDKAQTDPIEKEKCFLLNAQAPQLIAQTASEFGAHVVQLSTDYVFDGSAADPYTETAAPHPLSNYAQAKYQGEQAVLAASPANIVVRTAWPFGAQGKNFVDTILAKASRGEPLSVVTDQVGSPTFVPDLCKALTKLLESQPHGVYHVVNSGQASWFELAQEVFELLGIPQKITPITTAQLSQPAERPAYSVLANTRLAPLRHWKDALTEYLMDKQIVFPA